MGTAWQPAEHHHLFRSVREFGRRRWWQVKLGGCWWWWRPKHLSCHSRISRGHLEQLSEASNGELPKRQEVSVLQVETADDWGDSSQVVSDNYYCYCSLKVQSKWRQLAAAANSDDDVWPAKFLTLGAGGRAKKSTLNSTVPWLRLRTNGGCGQLVSRPLESRAACNLFSAECCQWNERSSR